MPYLRFVPTLLQYDEGLYGETAHLVLDIANLLLDILLRPGSPRGKGGAVATVSA